MKERGEKRKNIIIKRVGGGKDVKERVEGIWKDLGVVVGVEEIKKIKWARRERRNMWVIRIGK